MPEITASGLDEFIRFTDAQFEGNLAYEEVAKRFFPLNLRYHSIVDTTLDPYSDKYYAQQVALYEEISGRKLNQWDGELHPVDIDSLLTAPNPLGIRNVSQAAEHVSALSTMVSLCALCEDAQVLDMGAGHGLSSELYAFMGCNVHAIDIDPGLTKLSEQRSAARHLSIRRTLMNYDDVSNLPAHVYDAAFCYQSLHHSLRPWDLIAALKERLNGNGVIGFAGEPIQNHWWPHWGIRLDYESLYVARKLGWFESGWSAEFIKDCFAVHGLTLRFFSGGHVGNDIALAAVSQARHAAITERARILGIIERHTQQPIPKKTASTKLRNLFCLRC
jgi:2-polyprenyl-3-methyl-5-hydroxy-6-metoxy-1,4-benzoquinol methylase